MDRYRFLGTKLSNVMEQVMLGIRPGDKECEIAGRIGVELWKDRIDPTGILIAADERVAATQQPDARPGWVRAQLPVESPDYSARQLLRLGTEVEVLEPPALREAVAREARQVARVHAARVQTPGARRPARRADNATVHPAPTTPDARDARRR